MAITGSPQTVAVTLNVLAPPSLTAGPALTFNVMNGTNTQPITITNTGGGTLTWTVGAPSAAWLKVRPTTGSDTSQASSPVTFSMKVKGLSPGTYTATVVITPSAGAAVTVNVTLTVN